MRTACLPLMSKRILPLLALAPLLLAVGCSAPASVGPIGRGAARVEADPAKDFSGYRTYAFAPGRLAAQPGTTTLTPGEVDARLRAALEPRLAARGLTPAGAGEPDLVVTSLVSVRRQGETGRPVRDPNGYDEPGAIMPGGEWGGRASSEGTLILQFLDARTQERVWQATVPVDIDQGPRKLAATVDAALKDYPPRGK